MLSHTHTLTHKLLHTYTHTPTHTHKHALTHTQTRSLTHTHAHRLCCVHHSTPYICAPYTHTHPFLHIKWCPSHTAWHHPSLITGSNREVPLQRVRHKHVHTHTHTHTHTVFQYFS